MFNRNQFITNLSFQKSASSIAFKMLIRIHDGSFGLMFFQSFILLDRKPLIFAISFLLFSIYALYYVLTGARICIWCSKVHAHSH